MHLTVRVLGVTLLDIHLDTGTPEPVESEQSEQTVAHRHSGDFGFGTSPARPYWTPDYTELPAIP